MQKIGFPNDLKPVIFLALLFVVIGVTLVIVIREIWFRRVLTSLVFYVLAGSLIIGLIVGLVFQHRKSSVVTFVPLLCWPLIGFLVGGAITDILSLNKGLIFFWNLSLYFDWRLVGGF